MESEPRTSSQYEIQSSNGQYGLTVTVGAQMEWSLRDQMKPVIAPSRLALTLSDGRVLGDFARVTNAAVEHVDTQFNAIHYRKAVVRDQYTALTLRCEGGYRVEFRLYDDAVAYRFVTELAGPLVVKHETVNFNFTADHPAFIPYLWDYREGEIFNSSFESQYTEQRISEFKTDSISILPLLVDLGEGKKAVLLEADLEDYPGMYLDLNETGLGFKGVFPAYPLEARRGGFERMNLIPTRRADYIAQTVGERTFPWRVAALANADHELLNNDIVQKLAAPPRLEDYSWVTPGQVAWDWWNDYSLTHVDFEAGINTATFKYYIDFAAANHAKYIIMDGGWSDTFDLNQVNPNVDLEEILIYAESKSVGVILWASWYTITQQMHEVFPKYARMGVKGWKIDFIDRDDQIAVASTYEIAKLAAEYRLMVDYHGVFKPTGLQRTYPNVVGYEGVYGLENCKWADTDTPRYAVTIPFTRNMAGPMDYTSGAMTNATQAAFVARNHAPMSKGTRCHQMAHYIVFEVPIQMLSDSPSAYMREQECTDFITSIPTVFDETVALDGKVGEYVAVARKKDGVWYVGAMSNWQGRDLMIDFSFLEPGEYQARIFQDGVNANRDAEDYHKVAARLNAGDRLPIRLANGGGWVARVEKIA